MRKKIITRITFSFVVAFFALTMLQVTYAATSNIDPVNKWAWSTNIGWVNFNSANGGATVCNDHLEGYAWAENVGWIKLGTFSGCGSHTYSNISTLDYGVNKDSVGNLTGYAWGSNIGWLNFSPTNGGVTINQFSGSFDGYAWSENTGWIHFKNTGDFPYNVAKLFISFFPLIAK